MFETSKHVPKTEKRCCVFKHNNFCYMYVLQGLHGVISVHVFLGWDFDVEETTKESQKPQLLCL